MFSRYYYAQVELLLQVLPIVNEFECFALKGGTAINLFYQNMPRLSVDILCYAQHNISITTGVPEWDLLAIPHLKSFPSILWKLENINVVKKHPEKHQAIIDQLIKVLD